MTTSNQVASTQTLNIVPVQGVFNPDGSCVALVGPGGEYFYPPVNYSDVGNQPHIEAYDLSATIALSGTPTLLTPASTVAGANGITYDSATGEFTFAAAGSYTLSLFVNAIASASGQFVYIYAEKNTGSGWVKNANSGKYYALVNGQATQIAYPNAVYRNAGEKTRYWIYSNDGKVNLTTQTLPTVTGVYVPAIRIQYS